METTTTLERTNEEWLADLRAGGERQEAALEDLRAYLRRGLFAYLRDNQRNGDRGDLDDLGQQADDFVQEALLKVLNGLDSFRGESRFTTWAMKIAVRTAVSALRRAVYRDLSLDELRERGATLQFASDGAVGPAALPEPEREAERREVLATLDEGVRTQLTERQRTAFLATNVEGVPVEVAALLLDTNPNALYKTVHDARRKLRSYLIERGFTYDRVAPLFEST
jgi:RNA polymerase sigma-70 factor (ECF subfamily)